jgi:aminomethyltransferase
MPVQYPTGSIAEHLAVRQRCGLFDVSHMGEFEVRGPGAVAFVDSVTTNRVAALSVGQVHYSTILNERGTIEDDCLVYRLDDRLMMVVNASNRAKDFARLDASRGRFDCSLDDVSDRIALLALQGPVAEQTLKPFTSASLSSIPYYHFVQAEVAGVPAIVSRTGYTGEDGFELYVDSGGATALWDALLADGSVAPCGLGARDTLRLEMGMALYGNDIDDTTTPLEANLGWLVKMSKGDFVGRAALAAQQAAGVPRKLVGFVLDERCFPRHGYPVARGGEVVDQVRSGTVSPSLGDPIGTCYLPREAARVGEPLSVEIRGKKVSGRVVALPFYTSGSHR